MKKSEIHSKFQGYIVKQRHITWMLTSCKRNQCSFIFVLTVEGALRLYLFIIVDP